MYAFKMILQDHLTVDIKDLAAFAAGLKIETFLHGVGSFESFRFKGVLFARRHCFPEGHKRPLSGVLLLDGLTLAFGARALLCLFLSFFGLLALLSLNGAFKARRKSDHVGLPEGLYKKSRTTGLASAVVPVVEFQHLADAGC